MRILSLFLSVTALLLVVFYYLEWSHLGFPDGHKTELERATVTFYPFYMIIGGIFALHFLRIGWVSTSRNNVLRATAIFVLFIILIVLLNHYLNANLDHGVGG